MQVPDTLPPAPRPSLKERQKQLREDAILDAARYLMATKGYEAMTMDDVADHVGIAKATLYQQVKSKDDLALAVVIRAVRQARDFVLAPAPTTPAIERLRQILTWIIRERFGEPGIDFRAAETSVISLVTRNADFQQVEKELVDGIARLIDDAKAQGSISPGLSTRILARALLSFIQDGAYQEMLRVGECTIDDLINTFLSMITKNSTG